jgi:hypothetical protein
MAVVKHIGPGSAFKIGLVLYAILGLCLGVITAFVSMMVGPLGSLAGASSPGAKFFGFGMGLGAIIFFPLMYGLIGGIAAAISALAYNLVAGWVGGLEVDIS